MKIIFVVGARPNFMKIAPLMRAITSHNLKKPDFRIEALLVHTGQHYDYEMSQVFFDDLELPEPDIYLGVGSGTHAQQTGRIMIEFEKILVKERPHLVVVVGDVNSTLAAALTAAKLHIEAGIRIYDLSQPEEINRLLTDHVSDYLFTTTEYENNNLIKEGIVESKIFCVGNIMVDSLLSYKEIARKRDILTRLALNKKSYALLTLHRPDNVDEKQNLINILSAVVAISHEIQIVFPVHPRTVKRLNEFGLTDQFRENDKSGSSSESRILILDPIGYLDLLQLEMNASFIITDSGGIQVESTALGIPCLTLRERAAWPITLEQGTNILVGQDRTRLMEIANEIIEGNAKNGSCPKLWDGKTAERIVNCINKNFVA